ncbi:MAG: AHH domain-containing protein [bacterium]|nr:AHH domain-containing protein [bacterium]
MTQIIEKIAVNIPASEAAENCPFKLDCDAVGDEEEDILDDDKDSVQKIQENNGGTLGKNLASGSQGAAGTTNDLYGLDKATPQERFDTKVTNEKIRVKPAAGVADRGNGLYPFGVAAHHIIPGNASLKVSSLYNYMIQNGSVEDDNGKTFKIKENIGYNINGAHNGAWLVGNYAIRSKASPTGSTWSVLTGDDTTKKWCINYVAAAIKETGVQFHDVHTQYSEEVKSKLEAIKTQLQTHQTFCAECQTKTEVPPPYRIKERLYDISRGLKALLLVSDPNQWKLPWITSDKWKEELINPNSVFAQAYEDADPSNTRPTKRRRT